MEAATHIFKPFIVHYQRAKKYITNVFQLDKIAKVFRLINKKLLLHMQNLIQPIIAVNHKKFKKKVIAFRQFFHVPYRYTCTRVYKLTLPR